MQKVRQRDRAQGIEQTGAWRNPDFRRLWRASAISLFGTEIGELALPLLAIITLSASGSEVGLLRSLQFLPFLLATLPLGVLVDRVAKRPLMIGADLGRFLLIGLIPILIWFGVRDMEVLYLVVFAAGSLTVLYQLADFALLPFVVLSGQIIDANGKLSAAQSANQIAGKGVGGLIVESLTAPVAVLVDSLTYVASAISLSRMEPEPITHRSTRQTSPWRDAMAGLAVAVRNRYVRPLLGEATTFNLFNEIFILGLLLYAVRDLGLGPALIGLVFVAGGVGSFLGAWFGARFTARFGYGRVLLVTMILGNSVTAAVVFLDGGAIAGLWILVAVFWVMGFGIGVANVHAVSLRQTAVPDELRGRVNAAYRLISWGALPLGATIGGLLASSFGGRAAMLVGAFGIPLATVWIALSAIPRLRSIADAASG